MIAEPILADTVARTSVRGRVIGAVVLTDRACLDIEQVGYAKQVAGQVEYRSVAYRRREAGVENPGKSHPHFLW